MVLETGLARGPGCSTGDMALSVITDQVCHDAWPWRGRGVVQMAEVLCMQFVEVSVRHRE